MKKKTKKISEKNLREMTDICIPDKKKVSVNIIILKMTFRRVYLIIKIETK